MNGINETHEGAAGIGVGDDGAGGDFFAVSEDYGGGDAVFDKDLFDGSVGADLRARFLGGGGHGGSDGSGSADGELRGAGGSGIGGGADEKD